ncbi:MAG: hypothetical protein WCD42_06620 [Rhizomicrobium sp.]
MKPTLNDKDAPMRIHSPLPRFALREMEAAAAFGVSPGTFRILVSEGKMPRPTYISPRIPLWDMTDLQAAWLTLKERGGILQNNPWDE